MVLFISVFTVTSFSVILCWYVPHEALCNPVFKGAIWINDHYYYCTELVNLKQTQTHVLDVSGLSTEQCVSRLQLFIKQQLPADGHHVPSAARGHWAERRGHSGHQAASNPAGGAETAHTAVWEMSNNKSTTTTNAQTNTEKFVFLSIFICRRTESDTWCFITEDQTVKLWLPSCAQRDTTCAAHTAVY